MFLTYLHIFYQTPHKRDWETNIKNTAKNLKKLVLNPTTQKLDWLPPPRIKSWSRHRWPTDGRNRIPSEQRPQKMKTETEEKWNRIKQLETRIHTGAGTKTETENPWVATINGSGRQEKPAPTPLEAEWLIQWEQGAKPRQTKKKIVRQTERAERQAITKLGAEIQAGGARTKKPVRGTRNHWAGPMK
jgi:hypothetical protein